MQIPILSGIYTNSSADFRTSYPRNLIPVPKKTGISNGYLRPADGIVLFGAGTGTDRGAINWNGVLHRVMGTKLVSVADDGTISELGDVGGSGQVTFDYSFDRLAISSSGNFYYWDGSTLTQVTDADLGTVLDFIWVDSYFMTTDGEFVVVTDLNDPTSINPLKYGSSEADPDPVKGLLKIRNEPHALNRYTIEAFDNIGGSLFPFQRIEGAQIQKGVLGTYCADVLDNKIAFLGSGRKEAPSIYLAANSQAVQIATGEINQILSEYTEVELSTSLVETKVFDEHQLLYVHLPNKTLVYDLAASVASNEHVWFILDSGISDFAQYRAKNFVYCYDQWISGDPTSFNLGVFSSSVSSHYGELVSWEFGTAIIYNQSRGAIIHELELCALPGRAALGADPVVWASYSLDGMTYSQERPIKCGKQGETNKRLIWLQCGNMNNWRLQKFRGTSDSHISFARLEARIEQLR